MKNIKYQIGDYVKVNNEIRQVASITQKKIGYHIKDNESIMHYARFSEIEHIPITLKLLLKMNLF